MPTQEDDQIELVANFMPILSSSQSLFTHLKQQPKVISLEMTKHIVFIHKIGDNNLLTVCKKQIQPSTYTPAIEKSVILLERGFFLKKIHLKYL